MNASERQQRLEERVLAPLTGFSQTWFIWTGCLIALSVLGFIAYAYQVRDGLAVTGMGDDVIWGVYISNFVFFSGLSMAGTFISAILRLTGAEWRRPLTRFSELTTVAALSMCALMPAIDMGRPDRLWHLLVYGRLESPLLWDILVIPTYLAASLIYLFLFLIPDSALLRDRTGVRVSGARHRLYSIFGVRWRGLPEQRRRLELGGTIMMLMIIPLGVATHSVVSWIFGLTFRAGWNSTIFAPYFAVGALYSGTAMLITVMFIFRRVYHLEEYLTEKHFQYLAILLAAFGIIYLYFTFAEYLTVTYKLEGGEDLLLGELFFGRYAPLVWFGFFGGQLLPVVIAAIPKTRTIPLLVTVSVLANIGMWIKRFVIVVPSLSLPLMPYAWGVYTPTAAEIFITIASFAGFALLITIFAKLFPIISIWEMTEGWEEEHSAAEVPPAMPPAQLAPQG
ncbi:MAG: polysulfide reductase NrfD [Chloroflexi bacterium]|nr:polysulfide reductase NrfD [Chloroflexota bacterium]